MPLVYDQTLYESLYQINTDAGQIHYTRSLYNISPGRIANRVAMLPQGTVQSADVIVVGCGFGWLVEQAIDNGVAAAVGIDSSPFIQANKATESRGDVVILDATVGVTADNTIKSMLQAAGFKRTADLVIDEDAASSHSDAELQAFFDGCESLVSGNRPARVVHLVTPVSERGGNDPIINWKTMAEWKALRPAHTWIDIRTGIEEV